MRPLHGRMRAALAVVLMLLECAALAGSLSGHAALVTPWHLQGWSWRAVARPPDGANNTWVLVDFSGVEEFFAHARGDLADLRVTDMNGTELRFYVAEYDPIAGVARLAVYIGSPPPPLIEIYWGAGESSTVKPTALYIPNIYRDERGCILIDKYMPGEPAEYTVDLSWAKTFNPNTSKVWLVDVDTGQPVAQQARPAIQGSMVTILANLTGPACLVWGSQSPNITYIDYMLTIVVSERSGSELHDYPVKIVLDQSQIPGWDKQGSAVLNTIYFTDGNGNPLYYAVMQLGSQVIFWVKVPQIPANGQVKIYMHYGGNNPYTSYRDPDKVFIFYDFFDTDPNNNGKWIIRRHAHDANNECVWSNGVVYLTKSILWRGCNMQAKVSVSYPFTVEFRYRVIHFYKGEGMAFYFDLNTSALDQYGVGDGGTLALGGGHADGYAVELDNNQNPDDPSPNHIAVIRTDVYDETGGNGIPPYRHLAYYNTAATEDNKWHIIDAYINPSNIVVKLDGQVIISGVSIQPLGFNTIGLAAATRNLYNDHIVDYIVVLPYAYPEPSATFMNNKVSVSGPRIVSNYVVETNAAETGGAGAGGGRAVADLRPAEKPNVSVGRLPAENVSLEGALRGLPGWARSVLVYGLPLLPLLLLPAGYAGAAVAASAGLAWALHAAGLSPWSAAVLETLAALAALAVAVEQRKD